MDKKNIDIIEDYINDKINYFVAFDEWIDINDCYDLYNVNYKDLSDISIHVYMADEVKQTRRHCTDLFAQINKSGDIKWFVNIEDSGFAPILYECIPCKTKEEVENAIANLILDMICEIKNYDKNTNYLKMLELAKKYNVNHLPEWFLSDCENIKQQKRDFLNKNIQKEIDELEAYKVEIEHGSQDINFYKSYEFDMHLKEKEKLNER